MNEAQGKSSANPGILPFREIAQLIEAGEITAMSPIEGAQIQPASLDLRVGNTAHRVRASFLPGSDRSVGQVLRDYTVHQIDLHDGAVLETGCVYIVELQEHLALPGDISAMANPKSSTGRLDIFTRVISNQARKFDTLEAGYHGPLYLEVCPRTFPILLRTGSKLSQIRFRRGAARHSDEELWELHRTHGLVSPGEPKIDNGLALSVDLSGFGADRLVGYRAKRHSGAIDIDVPNACVVGDFWEKLMVQSHGGLILDPFEFYVLASREAVQVPPTHAAEMVPIDPLMGEFRVHYAGFFDPGFGHAPAGGSGSRAVLEVRAHEVPFIIEDGQFVGRLIYEKLTEQPDKLYGTDVGSNYQAQGLKLSKHFRDA
ncbi:MAG: 2'-deoxycytidine 5'-triphosphate deaminase [Alphaproteobacteria bacterium]